MVTEVIKIDNHGNGVKQALSVTEKAAEYGELDHKESIRLRLLSEELIGLMRGIAGDISSDFWIEQSEKDYNLHLKSEIFMNQELHKQFLEVATSGQNSAVKGFMGRLRETIAVALLPAGGDYSSVQNVPLGFMTLGNADSYQHSVNAYMWSLQNYKESLDSDEGTSDDVEEDRSELKRAAWDELEKSVVANIADDVKVSVKGAEVEIVINKNFG